MYIFSSIFKIFQHFQQTFPLKTTTVMHDSDMSLDDEIRNPQNSQKIIFLQTPFS